MSTIDTIRLDQLNACIRTVWCRVQTLHLVAGLLAFCRWAIPLFVLGMWIDWATYMPASGRGVILITLLAASFYRGWQCGWRHLRPFDPVHTALQIESHYGNLKSLLISAIQLRSPTPSGGSASLRERTCQLAEQAVSNVRPEHAVPYQPLRRPATIAAILAVLIGVFAVMNGPFLAAGIVRIFAPWVAAAYPTRTQITLEQTELVVKEGDSALIQARVDGVVPDQATISVRTGEGRAREIDLDITDGRCAYTIASASRDFTYRIKAGDDRTDWHEVRVVPAPRIQRVKVDLAFPAYLDRASESVEALTLTVPEGTGVNWQLALDQSISTAQFIRDGVEPVNLHISEDGREVSFTEVVSDSRGYSFEWVERKHGFRFASPRYYLQVASDQTPKVELTSPSTNLAAMLGRPLNLLIRAQDDHGIGSAKVDYRVNQREEQEFDVHAPIVSGQNDQAIDWDYRAALPDLQVGDTVSFTIQVSDRYPAPQGPHIARSETRRITFLSREQYLEQIAKKKDRLLSQIQTIYRQERGAYQLVAELIPDEDGYMQTCQLEAIRQEMVRTQLGEIAAQLQALLDDLAANHVSDAVEGESLGQVRRALLDIAESHVARAALLLRAQSGGEGDAKPMTGPALAAHAVNTAARELGRLVLLRDIDSAQEVYAREARMLAQVQASLRWRIVTAGADGEAQAVASEQDELAQWTDRLISDLQAGMRYDKRPLAVLRLIRSTKDLRIAHAAARMREAGTLIRQGKTDQAANLQADLVRTLLNAEFSVRLSGAYSTLLRTRDMLNALAQAQTLLREQCLATSPDAFQTKQPAFAKQQVALRRQLLTLLLPSIPAPRSALFDDGPPVAPPIHDLLAQADLAMAQAWSHLGTGQVEAAASQQLAATQTLAEVIRLVDRWSVDMGLQTQGMSTLVAATSERLSRIEAYEARVIGLLESTDLSATDKTRVERLAEPQLMLAEELAGFIKELLQQNQLEPDQDLPPLVSRLSVAERTMTAAVQSLKAHAADQAIGYQEQAADAFAQAHAIVVAQNQRLGLLQDLLMFQRAVGFASGYMADIVAEQRDLLAATKAAEPQALSTLLPVFGNLRKCMEDVAPLLDLVAGRLDVGTPLAFAKTDFDDAMASLKRTQKLDAIDAQEVAAESLAQVQQLIMAVQTQTGYVAEIVEFLHRSASDAATMQYQQEELKNTVASANEGQIQALAEDQRLLLARAQTYGQQLARATGMSDFTEPANLMRDALAQMEAKDTSAAAAQMQGAASLLAENAQAILAVITMLNGLPSIDVATQTGPELIRLIDVLELASAHKNLLRQTQVAGSQTMPDMADAQGALASRCQDIARNGPTHPMLESAHQHLTAAVAELRSAHRDAAHRSQKSADEHLRHFVVEQALILETAKAVASGGDPVPVEESPSSDTEHEMTAGFISDFVSGEAPKDKRTEWKVLADRSRAALNQNFARELPLEYRGLLKNYYERVAK